MHDTLPGRLITGQKVTGEHIRQYVVAENLYWFVFDFCRLCLAYTRFSWPGGKVIYEATCHCGYTPPIPSSWDELAKIFNESPNRELLLHQFRA